MKFKGSLFEERYNNYWNDHVVILDNKIRTISLGFGFFDKRLDVSKLIKLYQQHVLNVLINFDRQAPMFEDADYVQIYREDTISQATEDLNFYASIFPKHKTLSRELIDKLTSKPDMVSPTQFFRVLSLS